MKELSLSAWVLWQNRYATSQAKFTKKKNHTTVKVFGWRSPDKCCFSCCEWIDWKLRRDESAVAPSEAAHWLQKHKALLIFKVHSAELSSDFQSVWRTAAAGSLWFQPTHRACQLPIEGIFNLPLSSVNTRTNAFSLHIKRRDIWGQWQCNWSQKWLLQAAHNKPKDSAQEAIKSCKQLLKRLAWVLLC